MNRLRLIILTLIFSATNQVLSQNRHTLFAEFVKSDLFLKVIAPKIEKEGYEIFTIFGDDTLVTDFSFKNIYNNEYYIINEFGIWEIGVVTSHPEDYYLFFKFKNQYYIESSFDYNLILKRFLWFSKKAKLSKTDTIIYLYGIFKFLNESNNFTINHFNK